MSTAESPTSTTYPNDETVDRSVVDRILAAEAADRAPSTDAATDAGTDAGSGAGSGVGSGAGSGAGSGPSAGPAYDVLGLGAGSLLRGDQRSAGSTAASGAVVPGAAVPGAVVPGAAASGPAVSGPAVSGAAASSFEEHPEGTDAPGTDADPLGALVGRLDSDETAGATTPESTGATGPTAVPVRTAVPTTVSAAGSVPATTPPPAPVAPRTRAEAAAAASALPPGAAGTAGTVGPAALAGAAAAPTRRSELHGKRAGALPTLDELDLARPASDSGRAEWGLRGRLGRWSGGLLHPGPGRAERRYLHDVGRVQRNLLAPKTIAVVNPKGGSHKTTATLLLAATFGIHRGGYVLAWDNNDTRGTLGWRAAQTRHKHTAMTLLADLDRFADPHTARVGDLDNYMRPQGASQFDVLASDEDASAESIVDDRAFGALHGTLTRFYRVIVVDTGDNMRSPAWRAAVEAADQLVIVSTIREDTGASAAWLVDSLRRRGLEEKVRQAVTVLSDDGAVDRDVRSHLSDHFGRLTREVLEAPYDPALIRGGRLDVAALAPETRTAWLGIAAAVADGL